MNPIQDFNPWLPDTQALIPAQEGGNGKIHHPGQSQNVVWQTRSRVPDGFESTLIATLESLFDAGAETLPELVDALNDRRVYDRSGAPWNERSFREFLTINGY
ncbi:recombinase-like helix-turn-helix domain-containing protein [Enterobacillus tribolii]|uniref:Recombinase-like domain-containing protein n=1 Tax=Enterobacillus tribolii TaxID=1487935 RepID=A0A370QH41_9GAMM|nr:recombinase-like helix-turn-helix domain-containing protein [Enterobacillus tribolii]MBW7981736.1 hypothetical protein [Enterobacillus tribolii]RDK87420.1 hypothetical protein C8D90_10915 [Enterobacillus tribolii]